VPAGLTHLDAKGRARMVDVGGKEPTRRNAEARGSVILSPATLQAVVDQTVPKGDVLAAARIAGIMGGKRTSELIPLTHPIPLDSLSVEIVPDPALPGLRLSATASSFGRTGVEMEAITAVAVAAVTVYDMLKSMEKGIRITDIRLARKSGGKSGEYRAE
jgi:cyclic pyranopterin monophosphate synthase